MGRENLKERVWVFGPYACEVFTQIVLTSFLRTVSEQSAAKDTLLPEHRAPETEESQKALHITGCPDSCGQHWISDIGIEGKKLKVDGQWVDAYYFCVGGAVGALQAIARPLGYRCAATEVPAALERLLRAYGKVKSPTETLRSFLSRHSDAVWPESSKVFS